MRLQFEDIEVVIERPFSVYEPWQITGPADARVVCTPGVPAKLAIWS